jgi:two-component system sensor histidine kinase/response regulator
LLLSKSYNYQLLNFPYKPKKEILFPKSLLLLIAVFFSFVANAQVKEISKHPKIKAYVDSLNNRAAPLIRHDAGRAFTLLTEAELLANEYKYEKGLAIVYLNQAEVLSQRGYSQRALELYYRSMQLSLHSKDIYNVARAEQHISSIKRKGGSLVEAGVLLQRTLTIFTRLNKPVDMVNIMLRLGLLRTDQKQYDQASKYYDSAYQLSKENNYLYGEKKSYYNRALLFKTLNKPDSAIFFLHKALHIDTITKDNYGKALSYIELSRTYINLKQYKQAQPYARLGYAKADSVSALALVKTAAELLLYISKESLDKDAIIEWQDQLLLLDNTIAEREKRESTNFIDALRMQEEQQVKSQQRLLEVEKQSRKQDSLLIVYSVLLLAGAVLVVTLIYNYRKAKKYSAELNAKNKQIEHQNQKLEEDSELKSKLISIVSHDLRKPLANTQSIIQLVNMNLVTPEEQKDLFTQLEAQYTRVIGLTDNLLIWIKAQISGAVVKSVALNMQTVVNSIIEEQKIPLSEKKITVKNNLSADFAWLAEKETLRIVFRNLLSNAVKFTPAGGLIEIYGNNTVTETCITVKDTGIGMSPQAMERINSENYYSTKGTQNEEGSGFGLMLIRDLVKKQNGKLHIQSEPGKGSAFTISFPVAMLIKA